MGVLGDLNIYYNNVLENVDGFGNLKIINGDLAITRNDALRNVNGFHYVTEIGGYLYLFDNPSLQNVVGFKNIKSLGDTLYLGVVKTTNIDDLENCSAANGIILIENWFEQDEMIEQSIPIEDQVAIESA